MDAAHLPRSVRQFRADAPRPDLDLIPAVEDRLEALLAWREGRPARPTRRWPAAWSVPAAPPAFAVYRLLDAAGAVLYIGSSRRLRQRLLAHWQRWGDRVAAVVVEAHPDVEAMLAAERTAIAVERPPLNIAGVA